MLWVIILYALIVCWLTAYTMEMQGTTLTLGRLIARNSTGGEGLQDAITPKIQTFRNVLIAILFIVLITLVTYLYAWYHAIWVAIAAFYFGGILTAIFGMKAGSPWMVSKLLSDMEKRKNAYIKSGDELRSRMISDLIERIKNIPQDEIVNQIKQARKGA